MAHRPILPDSPIGAPIPVRTKADRDATAADLAAMRAEARAAGFTPELSSMVVAAVVPVMRKRAAIAAELARTDEAAA